MEQAFHLLPFSFRTFVYYAFNSLFATTKLRSYGNARAYVEYAPISAVGLLLLLFHDVAFFFTPLAFLLSQSNGVQSGVKKATYNSHFCAKGASW